MPVFSPQSQSAPWQDAGLVSRVRALAVAISDETVDLAIRIATVPAPTGSESDRALLVNEIFLELEVDNVVTDELSNVVGRIPGKLRDRSILLAAHLDTVFARDTPIKIVREVNRVAGPGVGDNSLGVAAVLMVYRMLRELAIVPATDILLTGNVGEEGLGNLRGVTRVLDDNPDIGAVVAVEGQNLGRITHIAVGSVRLRVTVTGPGGHSWGDFGNPSAIHAAARLIDALDRIPLTQSPKTTLSVGMISGGISINSIAPNATFDIDLRSTDPVSLKRLVDRVYAALSPRDDRISVEVEVLGKRPAGQVPAASHIVTTAAEVLRTLAYPPSADASSTDANVAISRGIPAICIGMTTGGNAHRLDEYIDTTQLATGLTQLVLLTLSLTDDLANGALNS
jgi:acetylornithine deacetylase/succinyl-diaminopimelate desuccinylase-like protein